MVVQMPGWFSRQSTRKIEYFFLRWLIKNNFSLLAVKPSLRLWGVSEKLVTDCQQNSSK
jgi:hypothetical protein